LPDRSPAQGKAIGDADTGMSAPKVALIGLDCATPQLLFERYAADMPHVSELLARSTWGPMASIAPPITVPAWSCMLSGRSPGELGIYGFRNRVDHSYDRLSIATSEHVRVPRIWDLLGAAGRDSVLLGVPGTYPPPPVRGWVIGDFLSPSTSADWTYPRTLGAEIEGLVGPYALDVHDFRSEDKARIAQQVFDMTEQRFRVARHLATTREWDLFAMVDMGPDRLHHGFWADCDPEHPRFDPAGPRRSVFRDYYRALDRHIGRLLETFDDDTAVLLVSDHGAQPMVGGFCINEWLREEGLLTLRTEPTGRLPIAEAPIDWSRTVAWADGGYYARVFLNVAGREPQGTIAPGDYDAARDAIAETIEELPDHEGRPMGNRAMRPEELYPEVNGVAPDLIVYLGDLRWRSVGTLGLGQGLYTFENDTGPDDANHAATGVFALSAAGVGTGRVDDVSIYDVAPTLQRLLGLAPPPGQSGRILV
jgi:predicted AlkP superfamily phosphohydrolase/phosphomutase